ncbi:MAG: crotonase/enoyl-CoA hydratase family protein [Myxococcales bacterium]|nr:crotonase/enoyl-CoA hydratase family protein [Myxococcales bacterium]
MTDSRVLVSIEDHIAHVRLNRPEKRNGLDLAMFEGIVAAGERLKGESSVRAVVLSGEGHAFCAGLDFQAFFAMGDVAQRLLDRPAGSPANLAQRVAWIWRELPMPVIAAIQGPCFGGGLQIALGADIRLVRPDAQLSIMEIKWGLVPDMSLSKTVLDLVPLDVAKELMFTGRVVDGVEAVVLGLATRAVEDPLAEALALAAIIASKNPHAIRAGKLLLDEVGELSTAEAFQFETELQLPLLGSANNMEAVQANMQKRAPVFRDPD